MNYDSLKFLLQSVYQPGLNQAMRLDMPYNTMHNALIVRHSQIREDAESLVDFSVEKKASSLDDCIRVSSRSVIAHVSNHSRINQAVKGS